MIEFLLGLIIGLLVGAGFIYWALKQKLREQKRELKQTKRTITNLTSAHELQIQDTVNALKRDYRRQLEAETALLAQQYAAQQPGLSNNLEPLSEPTVEKSSELEQIAPTASAEVSLPTTPPAALPSHGVMPIADPWGEPAATPMPDSASLPDSAPNEAPPVTTPVEPASSSINAEPKQPVSTHDAIATWGQSGGSISQILAYHNASDATLRQQVAIALGQRYSGQPIRPGDQTVISTLATLGRDSNPGVRRAAVEALSTVKSAAVIPVLQRALRDTDAGVVKAASLAIAQFKHYPMPLSKTALPKPIRR